MSTSSEFHITIGESTYRVEVLNRNGSRLTFSVDGTEYSLDVKPALIARPPVSQTKRTEQRAVRESTSTEVRAPMPGIISEVVVTAGATIAPGDTLVVIEAMKMENPIKSPRGGTIRTVCVSKNQEVLAGAQLILFE